MNPTTTSCWNYREAFSRNLGLVNAAEQEQLRNSRVAVVGLGGVGGIDLVTLARLGISRFTIADPDIFEMANTNRQFGAMQSTMQQLKADVMAKIVHDINPEADIRIFREHIGSHNAEQFLKDADIMADGIDAFEIEVRRILFRQAARQGIYALGAGPVGFSTAWVIFDPKGMSFDDYFGLSDGMDSIEQFAAYIVGMVPKATQRVYMDISEIDFDAHRGPSVGAACELAAGVLTAEVAKILLKRGVRCCAPHYYQFDPYVGRFIHGRLIAGGKYHPLQRLKRWWLIQYLRSRQITSPPK